MVCSVSEQRFRRVGYIYKGLTRHKSQSPTSYLDMIGQGVMKDNGTMKGK